MLIGEAPDSKAIRAVIEAARTRHPVYTTLHSSSVPETMRRLISAFNLEENQSARVDILETVRVIIWQQLVMGVNGKRLALREFLVFDETTRNVLLQTPAHHITTTTRRLLHEQGQPIALDAQRKFHEGKISAQSFQRFQNIESFHSV